MANNPTNFALPGAQASTVIKMNTTSNVTDWKVRNKGDGPNDENEQRNMNKTM